MSHYKSNLPKRKESENEGNYQAQEFIKKVQEADQKVAEEWDEKLWNGMKTYSSLPHIFLCCIGERH